MTNAELIEAARWVENKTIIVGLDTRWPLLTYLADALEAADKRIAEQEAERDEAISLLRELNDDEMTRPATAKRRAELCAFLARYPEP